MIRFIQFLSLLFGQGGFYHLIEEFPDRLVDMFFHERIIKSLRLYSQGIPCLLDADGISRRASLKRCP